MDFKKINHSKLGFFRFGRIGKKYLLTNETGDYAFLNPAEFDKFIFGKLGNKAKYKELCRKNFIRDKQNFSKVIEKFRAKHSFLFSGPSLHILVVTLRCNYNCVYCQTSSKGPADKSLDMDVKTARRVIDTAFKSPNHFLAIELQGGEPLLNWKTVKFVVEYARRKNEAAKKNLEIRLVSNFSLMDEEKLRFLFDNNVSICTSLDGPPEIHNKNRPFAGGNSYEVTTKWLGRAMELYKEYERKEKKEKQRLHIYQPGAVVTPSRLALSRSRKIVDEYLGWGFEIIFLRPLNPFGFAGTAWQNIGYTPEEYLKFYESSLDYILELNKKGKRFLEKTAVMILTKILTDRDANYLELRSPCGAGIGQMAYDYNGDVYTCDEGRMVGYSGNDIFKLGNVHKNSYEELIENPTNKAMCLASEISSQAGCSQCVYAPYCGVCPIFNYITQGNIFGQSPTNSRCQINKGIFEILFKRLADPKNEKIFRKWAAYDLRRAKLQQLANKNYEKRS